MVRWSASCHPRWPLARCWRGYRRRPRPRGCTPPGVPAIDAWSSCPPLFVDAAPDTHVTNRGPDLRIRVASRQDPDTAGGAEPPAMADGAWRAHLPGAAPCLAGRRPSAMDSGGIDDLYTGG